MACYAGESYKVRYEAQEVNFVSNLNPVVVITLSTGKEVVTNLQCTAEQQ